MAESMTYHLSLIHIEMCIRDRRMIDTVIAGLHDNGITEIYIVAGYLKEQFYELENEYPGVKMCIRDRFLSTEIRICL